MKPRTQSRELPKNLTCSSYQHHSTVAPPNASTMLTAAHGAKATVSSCLPRREEMRTQPTSWPDPALSASFAGLFRSFAPRARGGCGRPARRSATPPRGGRGGGCPRRRSPVAVGPITVPEIGRSAETRGRRIASNAKTRSPVGVREGSPGNGPTALARRIWRQGRPIPADPDHPVRRWAARRHLCPAVRVSLEVVALKSRDSGLPEPAFHGSTERLLSG